MTHPSNPDMVMAKALGVCWHPPTSDRWPCTARPEPGSVSGDGWAAPETEADHPLRLVSADPIESEVEWVAAALWEAQKHVLVTPWDELSPTTPTRTDYRDYARAALAASRGRSHEVIASWLAAKYTALEIPSADVPEQDADADADKLLALLDGSA